MNLTRSYRLLFTISIGATVIIGALALAGHLLLFPPQHRGWNERAAGGAEVAGWIVNESTPEERVPVQLYIDGEFAGAIVADLPRPDVVRAGFAQDERCGYRFPLPALTPGKHTARVYAVHTVGSGQVRTLQLTGEPLSFEVSAGDALMK